MTDVKDSKSELAIKDIYYDIVSRFDATQRSQASIHQILSYLVREVHDLKQRQAMGNGRWP
jgi:hypothetical protein